MSVIGVDYGATANLFNTGQSLGASLASAFGGAGSMRRQLMEDQHNKNLAYIEAAGAKSALDRQEFGGRNDLSRAAADIARAHAQGTSNAGSAGAAPAPVDINDARSRFAGAQQLLATGANDSAVGLNHTLGGLGMAFGPHDRFRENYALTGGSPTSGNVFGAWDKAGTGAEIAVEGAKTQGRIQQDAADVPNKIAIDAGKQQNDLALDPMKNKESLIFQLEKKKHDAGGMLSPDDEAQLGLAKRLVQPQADISFEDKGTGQHVVVPQTGSRIGDIYGGAPTPVPVQPGAAPAPAPSPAAPPPTAAPAIVGDPAGTMRFGSPKPSAAPTDAQGHTFKYARAKIDAEATLQNFTQNTQIPSQMDGIIRSAQNSGMSAQQFWESLPDEKSRAYFDAAYLFLIGTLRQESGAAIGMNEFAQRYPTLLPSAHATPDEIARKTALRKSDIAGDYSMIPQHLQQEMDNHAKRAGVLFHDEDVPYVQPYDPSAQKAPAAGGIPTYNPATGEFE